MYSKKLNYIKTMFYFFVALQTHNTFKREFYFGFHTVFLKLEILKLFLLYFPPLKFKLSMNLFLSGKKALRSKIDRIKKKKKILARNK